MVEGHDDHESVIAARIGYDYGASARVEDQRIGREG
jgi:hypothetical protein